MKRIAATFRSVDEIHALGAEYLLTWCFIHATNDELLSPLLTALESYEFTDIPTILVTLRLASNKWIGMEISKPTHVPELLCFSCGGGLCRIHELDKLEESIGVALNMANQLRSSWLGQRGKADI